MHKAVKSSKSAFVFFGKSAFVFLLIPKPSTDTLVVLSKALDMEIIELLVIDGEFDYYQNNSLRIQPPVQ